MLTQCPRAPRREQAFTPDSGFWSGNLPTLTLDPGSASAAGVARVFYMSVLTVVSQMRTNLPLIFERVWPNGNGNVGHTTMGIGGSRSCECRNGPAQAGRRDPERDRCCEQGGGTRASPR